MGSRLTRRLHSAGWNVRAWNRSRGPADVLRREGVVIAASVAELVVDSDVVLSSLANDEAVYSVYFAKGGVFSAAKRGTIILEMSTISPELSRLLHRQACTLGICFLDMAISGSTPAVEAGTITLLAGGDQKTFEQCAPIYESIAKQWFLMGPGSSGVLMKLVVNLLLGLDMQAIAEAVSLGEHLKIDRNRYARCPIQDSGDTAGVCGEIPENKERRLLSGIPPAADEQRHGSGYECRKKLGCCFACGNCRPIRTCLQYLRKWRSRFGRDNAVCHRSESERVG